LRTGFRVPGQYNFIDVAFIRKRLDRLTMGLCGRERGKKDQWGPGKFLKHQDGKEGKCRRNIESYLLPEK
jgi:hypothetical protein